MHHIAVTLAARRWRCRCGALAEEPFGLCPKCRSRAAWRRRHRKPRRNATRRLGGRARDRARRLIRAARRPLPSETGRTAKRPAAADLPAYNTHRRTEAPCRPPTAEGGEL